MRPWSEEPVNNRGYLSMVEMQELYIQVKVLSDESLVEEVMYFTDKADLEKSTQALLAGFMDTGILGPVDRAKLEAAYVLFYTAFVQEE